MSLKNYNRASEGQQAEVDHFISKHYGNSSTYLQQQVAELFRLNISLERVIRVRHEAYKRDIRDDNLCASLRLYENYGYNE